MPKTTRATQTPKVPKSAPAAKSEATNAAKKTTGPVAASTIPAKPADRMDAAPATAISTPRPTVPTSQIDFNVHPGMNEIQQFARDQGWLAQGYTQLSVFAQELVYTTDNWKTTQVLKSYEVPSPFINGRIQIPNVPAGTQVEFALHVSVACHAPSDIAGYRERGQVWLNNGGQNYRQITR